MNLRVLLLGMIWFCIMLLLFLTPVKEPQTFYFGTIPSKSIIHGLLFWGFVHIWSATLKKQLKYEFLKQHTLKVVFLGAVLLTVTLELVIIGLFIQSSFSFWNIFFDIVGICAGLISFRLLYTKCY